MCFFGGGGNSVLHQTFIFLLLPILLQVSPIKLLALVYAFRNSFEAHGAVPVVNMAVT